MTLNPSGYTEVKEGRGFSFTVRLDPGFADGGTVYVQVEDTTLGYHNHTYKNLSFLPGQAEQDAHQRVPEFSANYANHEVVARIARSNHRGVVGDYDIGSPDRLPSR